MHAAMTSITSALMAVNGGDEASVRPITDALNANGFNCDTDMVSGAFLGLSEADVAALHLNMKQRATLVCAAQDAKRRRLNEGEWVPFWGALLSNNTGGPTAALILHICMWTECILNVWTD